MTIRRVSILGDGVFVPLNALAAFLLAQGVSVDLLTFGRSSLVQGVKTHRIPGRTRGGALLSKPWVESRLECLTPDIVHAFYLTSYGYLSTASRRFPVLVTAMGSDVFGAPDLSSALAPARRLLATRALRHATAVHSVAPHMTRKLIELGAAPSVVHTFPRGVDSDRFEIGDVGRFGNPIRILSNRKLEPVYDPLVIIEAAARLRETEIDFELTICGDGWMRLELERRVQSLGIARRVKFLGAIAHEKMPGLLRETDIYVSASRSDGTSSSLLEALAAGCVPVVTRIEANEGWIEHGRTGWLFPVGSSAALADSILEAVHHAERWPTLRRSNRDLVVNNASVQRGFERISGIYEQLAFAHA